MKYTFLIEYKVYTAQRVVVKSGEFRVKNQSDEASARRGLEAHLKRTVPGADRVDLGSCRNETIEKAEADALALAQDMIRSKRAAGDMSYGMKEAVKDMMGMNRRDPYANLFGDE